MCREFTADLDVETKLKVISKIHWKVQVKTKNSKNYMGWLGGEPRLTGVTVSGRLEERLEFESNDSSNQIVSDTGTGTSRDSVSHGKESQTPEGF